MIKGILAALLALVGVTPCDQNFLDALRSHGVEYESPEWAFWDAHQICLELEQGFTPEQLAQTLMQQSNLDGYHAGFFVGASIQTYCPQWIGR